MQSFWPDCLARLQAELTPQQFNTWIKPLHCEQDEDGVTLLAPNRFVMQWVRDRFLARLEELANDVIGEPVALTLALGTKPAKKPGAAAEPGAEAPAPRQEPPAAGREEAPAAKVEAPAVITRKDESRLNPNFTFDTFVTGKANQLARAAAIQVGEHPGTAYNPLFVYGGVGLGKTHLIQAIGNSVRQRKPDAKIRYLHAERYVSDVVRAYQHKAFDEFKRHYHSLDLLLIDDIQFFSGKNRTQEEFFYAFNALTEAHKQVIITCDTYPKEISGMEDRLISRFGWGLTVAIEPPELEMRVAILLRKAAADGIHLDEDVAFFIAKQIRSNVRELEGALKRVMAFSKFSGRPVVLDTAKEALKDLLAVQNRQISIENIQKTVADYYKIKVADMYSKKRTQAVARPRQIAMALAKELTQMSLPAIGEAFGGRDHTTVLHACRKVADLKDADQSLSRDFNVLLQVLRG